MEDFPASVWALVRRIPRGRVMTYGQIADALGCFGRARAVGFAMRRAPHDVPWHRVVSSRGVISPRPDTGSMREQRRRLEAEGVSFDAEGRMDLRAHLWEP
ncbi:MAG: MGMT family protein [Armatimonadetes bacterium]|nr:MGMT family protein [Armatimonadota bacterium]